MKKIKHFSYALLLTVLAACNSMAQSNNLNTTDFEKQITSTTPIQLLDVRTADEYNQQHLKNALQANWLNKSEFESRTSALDKNKPVYVYCLAGGRSAAAANWLMQKGFTKVYNLMGGITAWQQANKPVEQVAAVPQISLQAYIASIPKNKKVLVDVGAQWCPPCKKMEPIVKQLAKKYTVININGGEQTQLCKSLNISAFPVFIVYNNGKEQARLQGVVTQQALEKLLQ